jgi:hypothetical protein
LSVVRGKIKPMGGKRDDYKAAIKWLKARGWRVDEDRSGYPMAYCPCGRHQKTVHLTPSNPHYYQQLRNRVQMIERVKCPNKEEGTEK